jgi:hypothetical protein
MAGRLNKLWSRICRLGKRKELDRDLEDELAYHLHRRAQKNRDAGIRHKQFHVSCFCAGFKTAMTPD